MSALDGWIDVCRAGTWRDMAGREVALDEARFDRIVDAHAAADPAPVVVGHPETDAPAFAWIAGLRREGDRLQATLRDIAPAFRQAVEAGRYAGRSIALQGDTLRHLGFLGGRAPAVPGLAPTQFADEPSQVIGLSVVTLAGEGPAVWNALEMVLRGLRERMIETDGMQAADTAIPEFAIQTVADAAAAPAETAPAFSSSRARDPSGAFSSSRARDPSGAFSSSRARDPSGASDAAPDADTHARDDHPEHNRQEGAMPKTEAELAAESDALDQRKGALDTRETDLAAREAAQQARDRLAAAEAALKPHLEAGRVLPAETSRLAALLASLPAGDDDALTFAAPGDGAGEVRETPAKALDAFLAGLPKRVTFERLADGAAPEAKAEDSEAIGAEARQLMADAKAKGQTLTHGQAVDQARAKRGLSTGGDAQ